MFNSTIPLLPLAPQMLTYSAQWVPFRALRFRPGNLSSREFFQLLGSENNCYDLNRHWVSHRGTRLDELAGPFSDGRGANLDAMDIFNNGDPSWTNPKYIQGSKLLR